MYHYTNQPIYNNDIYQHSSVIALGKGNSEGTNTVGQNEYNTNPHTFVPLEVSHDAPTELRDHKTDKPLKPCKKSVVDTSNFSIEERLVAAVWVHERKRTNVGMSQIKQEFQQRFGRDPPAKNTLLSWERKLFATGSVHDAPRPGRPVKRLSRLEEVRASVRASPALSVRARARFLRLPPSTLRALLRRDLNAAPDKSPLRLKPKLPGNKKTPVAFPEAHIAATVTNAR